MPHIKNNTLTQSFSKCPRVSKRFCIIISFDKPDCVLAIVKGFYLPPNTVRDKEFLMNLIKTLCGLWCSPPAGVPFFSGE